MNSESLQIPSLPCEGGRAQGPFVRRDINEGFSCGLKGHGTWSLSWRERQMDKLPIWLGTHHDLVSVGDGTVNNLINRIELIVYSVLCSHNPYLILVQSQ